MGLLTLIRSYNKAEDEVMKGMGLPIVLWSILGVGLFYGFLYILGLLSENILETIMIHSIVFGILSIVIYVVSLKMAIKKFSINDKITKFVFTTDIGIGMIILTTVIESFLAGSYTFRSVGFVPLVAMMVVPFFVSEQKIEQPAQPEQPTEPEGPAQ